MKSDPVKAWKLGNMLQIWFLYFLLRTNKLGVVKPPEFSFSFQWINFKGLIWHFVLFSFKPLSLIFKKTFLWRSSCSCKVFPYITKSSWDFVIHGTSEIIEVTSLWKTSLAEWIPYGKRLKWYLLEWVPHASKFEIHSSTLICQ